MLIPCGQGSSLCPERLPLWWSQGFSSPIWNLPMAVQPRKFHPPPSIIPPSTHPTCLTSFPNPFAYVPCSQQGCRRRVSLRGQASVPQSGPCCPDLPKARAQLWWVFCTPVLLPQIQLAVLVWVQYTAACGYDSSEGCQNGTVNITVFCTEFISGCYIYVYINI
jgi:hypothetical protein